MWFFYNFFFTLIYILMLPRFLWRMWRRGGYRRGFLQRLAVYDRSVTDRLAGPDRIWVHAVSVGEMRVALDFITAMRELDPRSAFILTTATSTGHALAQSMMDPRDLLLYYPADFPPVIARALDRLHPRALVLVDGEFWPNLLRQLQARHIPSALINGRISQRSFRGYRRLHRWTAPTMARLEFCGMQSAIDARRIVDLGARPATVQTTGSAKYDVALAMVRKHSGTDMHNMQNMQNMQKTLRAAAGRQARFLLGGSTWPGEELVLIDIFQKLRGGDPNARLILVPRHVERCRNLLPLFRRRGIDCIRWSALRDRQSTQSQRLTDALLVDTTGDLPDFYALAEVIFVGKSLCRHGGQNVVEPAAFGKAVAVGPHMENFPGIMEDMLNARAIVQADDRAELAEQITNLWNDAAMREAYGNRARQLVADRAGTAAVNARCIAALLKPAEAENAISRQYKVDT